MRRRLVCAALLALTGVFGVTSTGAAADSQASCNGILVSSLAGQAGVVAELTRLFHQQAKDAGFPPGILIDVPGGQIHAGDVEACLAALSG